MDFDPQPYNLMQGISGWGQLVGILILFALAIGLLLSFSGNGSGGLAAFTSGLKSFIQDIFSVSLKRIFAICGLTLKESLRRKALLVFVVFAVLLMFGGWFLTDSNDRPELQFGVHVTFMLTVISWLILPIAIFLSCWGIPEDIRIRSLHTVVTKPVRRIEVVAGRILGYSTMVSIVLVLMGIVGYVWIQRQVPDTVTSASGVERELMTCRVPVYGRLFFLDRQGLPKRTGINVGDAWLYRSFVEGNSASRAVWWFQGITPDAIGEELLLESRFEAFRTVKGSAESVQKGVEGQYILVNDLRSDAFSSLGIGATFSEVADAFKDGNFSTAADNLDKAADGLENSSSAFPATDCQLLGTACVGQAVPALSRMGEDFERVRDGFFELGRAAGQVQEGNTASYGTLADACRDLAKIVRDEAEDLLENMPRIEVPLEPFRVAEYHEGENVDAYPRTLSYAATNEATARFLAKTITEFGESGKLMEGDQISPELAVALEDEAGVSAINAEMVQAFLETELSEGILKAEDGKLTVADGRRWLTYLDQVVREERLVSQDPAGWMLEVDLFQDLAPDGVLRVEVACLNDQMYLGMARPDLFIRLKDQPFWKGYGKALLSIGLMLCLVVVIGVTASCVVKGPVSFFLTLTVFVVGQFFHPFMQSVVSGNEEGAGLVNSAILMVQHRNPSTGADLSESRQKLVDTVDQGFLKVLQGASKIVPDFQTFSDSTTYIENGFDVPWASSVLPSLATFFGFLLPCILIGAACLKFRELEAK